MILRLDINLNLSKPTSTNTSCNTQRIDKQRLPMRKIKNRVIILMLASLVPILVILTLLNYKVRSQNYTIAEKNISHAIHEIKFFQLSLTTKTREILSLLSQEDEGQALEDYLHRSRDVRNKLPYLTGQIKNN